MKKELSRLIKSHYPNKVYSPPEDSILDRVVKKKDIEEIARWIKKIRKSEIDVEKQSENDHHWEFRIYSPSKNEVRVQNWSQRRMKSVYKSEPKYMMLINISRLGPYYILYWNQFRIVNGKFEVKFMKVARRKEDKKFEIEVCKILNSKGLIRLHKNEYREKVPWMKSGYPLIRGKPTVYNCLFSEV